MITDHRNAACRISAPDESRQGMVASSPLPATNPRQPGSASDGDGGGRTSSHPTSQAAAATPSHHRQEVAHPADVAGGADRRPDGAPPAPITNPGNSSSQGAGYGGQEPFLPDRLSAGPIPEGELAPAWRALKRGIAQSFRKKRRDTFDPVVLSNARWFGIATGTYACSLTMSGIILISGARAPELATVMLWSAFVFAVLFMLNLPRLGWQERLEQQRTEQFRARSAGRKIIEQAFPGVMA